MNKVVERRLELLEMEAKGFSHCEIVKVLSVKYRKTERIIYYDFETRGTWQPLFSQLFDSETGVLIIINRLEHIYRKASLIAETGSESGKLNALKIMQSVTNDLIQLQLKELQHKEFLESTKEETRKLLELYNKVVTG